MVSTQLPPVERPGVRIPELDALRGFAATWVVCFHYNLQYETAYHKATHTIFWFSIEGLSQKLIGLMGVYLFFIISGFVIALALENCANVWDFVVSRFSRLYPTYWTALIVTTCVGVLFPLPQQDYSIGQVVANATMFQSVFGVADVDGVYWSLLVELLFYVMMGTIFRIGWMRWIHEICLLWISAALLTNLLALINIEVFWRVQKYALLFQCHFLGAGVMFFQIWRGHRRRLSYVILVLALASIVLAYPPKVAAVCAVFFVLFGLLVHGRLCVIAVAPMLWLGSVSYALYVTHQMLGYRVIMTVEEAGYGREAGIALALLMALAVAWLVTVQVERPAMRAIRQAWRRRGANRVFR